MRKKKNAAPEVIIPEDNKTEELNIEITGIDNTIDTNIDITRVEDIGITKAEDQNIEEINTDSTKTEDSNIEVTNIEDTNIDNSKAEDSNIKNTNIEIISDTEEENRLIPKTEIHTLCIENLHKKFGRKEVVKGVDFIMQNGEVAGLLGPNGAGKTTIFYMIVGFYTPTQGIVKMDNIDITSMPMYRRARMGIAYLPQEASIFRKLTVKQNIWAILESRRDITKEQKMEKLESLLNEFNIARIRDQFGYTLSGGERRRTEIARALATEPKFLLLDEPFAGIDPIAVFDIKQIIRQLADKGIGILITDHNVRDTLEITNESFIIADGIIFANGDKDSILNNEKVRRLYLGSEFRM